MKLLLDIGNSSIAWALQAANKFSSHGCFPYTAEMLAEAIEKELQAVSEPKAVLMASVAADQDNRIIIDTIKQRWQLDVWQAKVSEEFDGLRNSYTDCQQMGIDRWLAMIAAWSEYRSALCVVDCGTALTIDLIETSGQHAGGFILPGMVMMQQALINSTGKINASPLPDFSLSYGQNTQEAISHGACLALTGAIKHAVEDFSSKTDAQVQCVITGGYAEELMAILNSDIDYRPCLVLDGLSKLYEASL